MKLDSTRARLDTPGCDDHIHFNNAGAALMPRPVLDATIDHLRLEGRIGGYEAADAVAERIDGIYAALATLIGADRSGIAITSSATRAWDMAFYGVKLGEGDRILTSASEYGSNYIAMLQRARRTGAVVEIIPDAPGGGVNPEALEAMIDSRVKLIAITHVPSNGGLVNPAAEIGRIARHHGVLYLLDACQSVGQMPVDVSAIGCDILTATGRKYLRAPRGTGFLYADVRACKELEPPFLDLHSATWSARGEYTVRDDARRFEEWEANVAAKLGLGAAAEYALAWGIETIWERVRTLAEELRTKLAEIEGVDVRDLGNERCGIVTFTARQAEARAVARELSLRGISVSVSGVMAARIDMDARRLDGLVRASLHYYNSSEEIDAFCDALRTILGEGR